MATIDFDVDDYLDEASLAALESELRDRRLKGARDVEEWTPSGLADDLRNAFYARNACRFEMLLTVLQPHEKTTGLFQKPPKESV
jgi:hypothetical protein